MIFEVFIENNEHLFYFCLILAVDEGIFASSTKMSNK